MIRPHTALEAPDVRRAADSGAHLGLSAWTSASGAGSLFYTDIKGYRVAAGNPRVPYAEEFQLADVLEEFERDCRRAGRRPVYFGLSNKTLQALDPVPASAGMTGARGRWRAGDLPVFTLDRWRDPAAIPPGIRAQARRARNQGVTVRRLTAPSSSLRSCVESWLRIKPLPPLGFVTTPFLFDPWPSAGVFVAERGGVVVGFLIGSEALLPGLWRVDAVGRAESAPNGCAELLVSEAFRYAAEQDFQEATLGLAPLSRRTEHPEASSHWMDKVADLVREVNVPGYSFAGLETFKAKFEPDEWRPVYCLSGGGRLSLRDMLAVARAFAGGTLSGYVFRSVMWGFGRRRLSF